MIASLLCALRGGCWGSAATGRGRLATTERLRMSVRSLVVGRPTTASPRRIDRVCEPDWHTLGTPGVRLSNPIRSPRGADLHKYMWARTVSNRRPLVCKTRALPLSYAPVRRQDTARSAQAPKQPSEFRRSAPSAPRSTAAGHGPRRAASSRRTGSSRTGR